MGYAQNEDILIQDGEDHSIIADSIFSQSSEGAFKGGGGIRILRQFLFDGAEDSPGLRFIQPL